MEHRDVKIGEFVWDATKYKAVVVRKGQHPITVEMEDRYSDICRLIGGPSKGVFPFNKSLYPKLHDCMVYCSTKCPSSFGKVSREILNENFIIIGSEYDALGNEFRRSLTDEEIYEAHKLFFNFAPVYTEPVRPTYDF